MLLVLWTQYLSSETRSGADLSSEPLITFTSGQLDYASWPSKPGARTPLGPLGAPGLTTRSKKLLGTKGIATRSKDATLFRTKVPKNRL